MDGYPKLSSTLQPVLRRCLWESDLTQTIGRTFVPAEKTPSSDFPPNVTHCYNRIEWLGHQFPHLECR
jgi:hypothetical protein